MTITFTTGRDTSMNYTIFTTLTSSTFYSQPFSIQLIHL